MENNEELEGKKEAVSDTSVDEILEDTENDNINPLEDEAFSTEGVDEIPSVEDLDDSPILEDEIESNSLVDDVLSETDVNEPVEDEFPISADEEDEFPISADNVEEEFSPLSDDDFNNNGNDEFPSLDSDDFNNDEFPSNEENNEGENSTPFGTSFIANGNTYAASLFWQPLQNIDEPFLEIKETAETVLEGSDLYAIKKGNSAQFGLAISEDGHKSGQHVAAISLTTALSNESSAVCVFKVDNGWWYFAIRNDVILSDGDMLYHTEEEAKQQFMSMMAVPDWDKKIAPDDWDIEGSEELEIEDIITAGSVVKLKKINALRGKKLALVVGAGAFLALWLLSSIISGIMSHKPKRVIKPIRPKIIRRVQQVEEIKPWEKIIKPSEMMKNCYEYTADASLTLPPGWTLKTTACNGKTITADWIRNDGRISWMENALLEANLPITSKSYAADGNQLIAVIDIRKSKEIASIPLKNEKDMLQFINDTFQAIDQTIALSSITLPALNSDAKGVDKTPKYKALKFNFVSKHNPVIWSELLTKFSGIEVHNIKYDPTNKTWGYEGLIHVL